MARIGVFVCWCGHNIARTVDVEELVGMISVYPGVTYATHYKYMRSEPGQRIIHEAIKERGLAAVGLFRWLCLFVARMVNYKVIPYLIAFMLLSGFLTMFIDSITVLLFLASVTIEVAHLLKFGPVPVIIAEIFAANTGGAATMCGGLPNVIIGSTFGGTFSDFAVSSGPIGWTGMFMILGFFYFCFRKTLTSSQRKEPNAFAMRHREPREAIVNLRLFKINTALFILVVILLVTHAQTGLSVASIGCIAAFLTLLAASKDVHHIIRRVDWRTLLFFVGLFMCVAGLEETRVLKMLGEYIGKMSRGSLHFAILIIRWVSALGSAIVDNIPFAATMCPVIGQLSQTSGLNLTTLSWVLALGTDIGGNATPIGGSANVVGTAAAEREGYPIGWVTFCKYAVPATIMAVGLCWHLLIARYT